MTLMNSDKNTESSIFLNNVGDFCLQHDGTYFKVVHVNDRNLQKLKWLYEDKTSFNFSYDRIDEDTFKAVLAVYHHCAYEDKLEMDDDRSVICILERKRTKWACEVIKDVSLSVLRNELVRLFYKLSCEYYGVHIVAEWADGGSDSNIIPLYDADAFLREFPDADKQKVLDFYEGKGDEFEVRRWRDDCGTEVVDTVFYCSSTTTADNGSANEIVMEDNYSYLELLLSIKAYETISNPSKSE